MDSSRTFLLLVIQDVSFRNSMQTAHYSGLNKTDRSVNIMVLNPRDQNFFTFFDKVVLYSPDAFDAGYVFVELWIKRHMFGTNCKSLSMFVFMFYIQNEWYACWILGQHLFNELDIEMYTFHN